MKESVTRRKFLGGTAAALTGTAAMAGEAAAHSNNDPVFAPNTTWVREGPGTNYGLVREVDPETGMHIIDGPTSAEGYTWWKYEVNGDSGHHGRVTGWEIEAVTNHADFIYPTYGQITSTYWDCRDNCNRYHRACDIANAKYTDIGAGRGGTAYTYYDAGGYGNYVMIDHGNGFETLYGHLNDFSVVDGESVHTGEHIGYMGNTGHSYGDHVHYEIRYNGGRQNWNMDDGAYVYLYAGVPRNWGSIGPTYL